MEFKFLLVIIGATLINYTLRVLPVVLHNGKQPGRFVKSFLEYIPYAALGALLFPDVLYSTGSMMISAVGIIFAAVMILTNQNMIATVSGTIFLVYVLDTFTT